MAEVQLKSLLKGVEAEHGAIVTCRDPSALEMLLRLGNSDTNQGSISVMFQKRGSGSSGAGGGAGNGSLSVASGQMLFVNERFAHTLEDEVQSWLDPFRAGAGASSPTTAGKERKRARGDSESDESSFGGDSDSA